MTKSGILETRSNLSQIVNNIMLGEEHVILKNNVPVARIVPVGKDPLDNPRNLMMKIREIRKSFKKTTVDEINAWKREGRA
ncbi:MAG: type II toxin-antitoxin system prevent-host-death family antitoxin [Candidatus Omnitrophota bacterium]